MIKFELENKKTMTSSLTNRSQRPQLGTKKSQATNADRPVLNEQRGGDGKQRIILKEQFSGESSTLDNRYSAVDNSQCQVRQVETLVDTSSVIMDENSQEKVDNFPDSKKPDGLINFNVKVTETPKEHTPRYEKHLKPIPLNYKTLKAKTINDEEFNMFPISYLDPISPHKYNQLFNRLDFIEKKMVLSRKIRKIREQHECSVDLPAALAEALNRGLITCNQISQHVLQEKRTRQIINRGRARKIFNDQNNSSNPFSPNTEIWKRESSPKILNAFKSGKLVSRPLNQTLFQPNLHRPQELGAGMFRFTDPQPDLSIEYNLTNKSHAHSRPLIPKYEEETDIQVKLDPQILIKPLESLETSRFLNKRNGRKAIKLRKSNDQLEQMFHANHGLQLKVPDDDQLDETESPLRKSKFNTRNPNHQFLSNRIKGQLQETREIDSRY